MVRVEKAECLKNHSGTRDQWVSKFKDGSITGGVCSKLFAALFEGTDTVLAVVLQMGKLHRDRISSAGAETVQWKVIVQ